jgi:hypothetical protein
MYLFVFLNGTNRYVRCVRTVRILQTLHHPTSSRDSGKKLVRGWPAKLLAFPPNNIIKC